MRPPPFSLLPNSFNPRLRAGGDIADTAIAGRRRTVSTHASAREATR